jgi:hypothetical protein
MLSRIKRIVLKLLLRSETRRVTTSESAAPNVFRSGSRFYLSYRPDWDVEFSRYPEVSTLAERWVANNVTNNSCDIPRLYSLILNINQVIEEGVVGDFAELGVYRGNSASIISYYAQQHDRSVLLFDTFAGFDRRDVVGIDAGTPKAFSDTSLEMVRDTVDNDQAIYIRGFFPDTVTDEIACRRFAVVHLDCDLYEPMKAGLEFFYPRLSPGGMMIFHDYSNPHWEGAKRAVDEYLPRAIENLVLLPDKSGTAILRKIRA